MVRRIWIWGLLVMLAGTLFTPAVHGHGGGTPQVVNERVGPYRVSVWTQPEPLRVGDVHVTVAVTQPSADAASTNRPSSDTNDSTELLDTALLDTVVTDATVSLRFELRERPGAPFTAAATRQNSLGNLYYEADIELPAAGEWSTTVQVEGPLGAGSVAFSSAVLAARTVPWSAIAGIGLAVLALIAVMRIYQSRGTARQRSGSRRSSVRQQRA
jgi:hypothetical protein